MFRDLRKDFTREVINPLAYRFPALKKSGVRSVQFRRDRAGLGFTYRMR